MDNSYFIYSGNVIDDDAIYSRVGSALYSRMLRSM